MLRSQRAPFLNRPVTVLFSLIPNMVLRIEKFPPSNFNHIVGVPA